MSRDERITAVTFALMVAGWVFGSMLNLNGTAVAFTGFGVLLVAGVLTLDDMAKQASWPVLYVTLIALYVGLHYYFVSQSSHLLALLAVFLDVGIRGGVPVPLMAFGLLFATGYFAVITPQGGSQNVIFVGSAISRNANSISWGSSRRSPSWWCSS